MWQEGILSLKRNLLEPKVLTVHFRSDKLAYWQTGSFKWPKTCSQFTLHCTWQSKGGWQVKPTPRAGACSVLRLLLQDGDYDTHKSKVGRAQWVHSDHMGFFPDPDLVHGSLCKRCIRENKSKCRLFPFSKKNNI